MSLTNSNNKMYGTDRRLTDLRNALYVTTDDLVAIRTGIDGDIIISGDINIPGTVTVNSTPENPVHNHITEVGTSGLLAVPYMPINGTVSIGTDGTVSLSATTLSALENITVSGSVSVSNFPATQAVTGTFWQATQPVSGTVTANVTFPTTQQVSGTVALDTNTLSALENINATVNGTVSIGTDGTVSLSATTLSALENITVSGTVELGATTLSALENTTVTINGTPTVNIGTIPEVEIKNDSGNPVPISGTVSVNQPVAVTDNGTSLSIDDGGGSITVDGTVNAVFTGTVTTTVIDGQQDAFGRLRTSEAFTLGDYKHTYGIDPNFRDTLINGGTVTHIANQAAARLATSNNSSSRAIHQTKMYHNYMPGKSQLIKTTINFYGATANVTKRTGYFDDLNGIYFEQNGAGVLSFVVRTNTSGTASDSRRITQANWNKDKCDGTGASGFNLDITMTQIVFIDFQWLGVGRIRCGFVHNGQMIIAHEFYNSNNLPVVYMSNPNLPIRCEILNTGATAGGYFDQICSTVISEGGYVESGIDFSIDTGQTSQSITVANGMYPVVAIRLKNSFRGYPNRVVVRSGNINVYAEEYPAYWALFKLDNLSEITLSNPAWTSANADSAVEYTLLATAFTGGDRLDGGIVGTTSPGGSAKGTGTAPVNQPSNAKKNFIAQNLDSTDSEIYVVCGKAIGGTTKMWVDFQWREIY